VTILKVHLSSSYKLLMRLAGLVTFGVGALLLWLSTMSWPRLIDSDGITLRSGRRLHWGKLTEQRFVRFEDPRSAEGSTGRLELLFGRATVRIVPRSLAEGSAVLGFLTQVLGEQTPTR
jgi:hypothetical protein